MASYRCVAPFAFFVDGTPFVVTAGEVVSDVKDPRYKGHESEFELVDDYETRTTAQYAARSSGKVVEQATAAPGERRSYRAPKG